MERGIVKQIIIISALTYFQWPILYITRHLDPPRSERSGQQNGKVDAIWPCFTQSFFIFTIIRSFAV